MQELFTNTNLDGLLSFTHNGIICKRNNEIFFFPYGSITKINLSLGSFLVVGKMKGKVVTSSFIPSTKEDKKRIKELVSYAKEKIKDADPAEVIGIDEGEISL